MGAGLRTRVFRVEPERVQLTVDGTARVRVVGSGFGLLRCGSASRWVWGEFDESFCVRAPIHEVAVFGVGGVARALVRWTSRVDLRSPPSALPSHQARQRALTPAHRIGGAPRLAADAPGDLAPRLVPLTAADIARHASSGTPTHE